MVRSNAISGSTGSIGWSWSGDIGVLVRCWQYWYRSQRQFTRWFTRCRSFAGALYGSPVGSTLVLKSGVHQWVGPWVAGCCRGIITLVRCVISYFGIAPSSRCIIIGWSWICYAVGAFLSIMSASSSTTICRVIVYRQCNRWVAVGHHHHLRGRPCCLSVVQQ